MFHLNLKFDLTLLGTLNYLIIQKIQNVEKREVLIKQNVNYKIGLLKLKNLK